MKLYKMVEITDGPPPEFGFTRDVSVIANNQDEALALAKIKKEDLSSIKETELDKPIVIYNEYR